MLNTRPDSIAIVFTTEPGHRLPLIIDADISTSLQSVQSGFPEVNVDSVTVYTRGSIPRRCGPFTPSCYRVATSGAPPATMSGSSPGEV